MNKLLACLFACTVTLNVEAAVWERPAGGYTPTNHSLNITKYQTDSSNHVAISSAKVDGDINKAFQGLNDVESRTPPSVTGNAGKFLTNDGTATSWGLVSSTSISSAGASAGYVFQANGSGGAGWGLVSSTALGNSGVTSGTYPFASIIVNSAGIVTSATGSATPNLTGMTVGTITATTIAVSNLTVAGGTISTTGIPKAWARIQNTGSGCNVLNGYNVSGCQRVGTGNLGISVTGLANANYAALVTSIGQGSNAQACAYLSTSQSPTTAGFYIITSTCTGGASDSPSIQHVAVFD